MALTMKNSTPEKKVSPLVAGLRRIYNPIGFTKGYNFAMWFFFGGGFVIFTLSRMIFLDFDGYLCPKKPPLDRVKGSQGAVPGECYYFQNSFGRTGIMMHLAGILPACVLVFFQFIPVIRHRFTIIHRINGYIVLLLSTVGMIGVFLIAKPTFGGTIGMQAATGASVSVFIICQALAYYNIKKLQIEQHRAWMLRAWIIAGFVVSMRCISFIAATIASKTDTYYTITPCAVLDYTFGHNQTTVMGLYPDCATFYNGQNSNEVVMVRGDFGSPRPDLKAAGLNSSFGAGAWLALFIHCLAAEIYLRLTPAESERLRRISYQRQLERGMRNPGNEGLTVQRLGDAEPWVYPEDSGGVCEVPRVSNSTASV